MHESKRQKKPVCDIKGFEMRQRDSGVLVAAVMTISSNVYFALMTLAKRN
jgi:hypothetical protein